MIVGQTRSMTSFLQQHGYLALLLIGIGSSFLPIPTEGAYALAGAMCTVGFAANHTLNLVWVIVWCAIGGTIGGITAYELSRSAGRTIVDKWGKYLLLSHKDLDTSEAWFAKYGTVSVFLGRMIPVVRALISFPAGLARMKRLPYVILTFVGSAGWAAILAGIGYGLGTKWKSIEHPFKLAEYPVIAVIVIVFAAGIWHRWHSFHKAQG